MTASLDFDGLTFDTDSLHGYHLSRLIGWDDGAPVRYDAEDRPQAHGTFRPGRTWRGARVVSVEGSWAGQTLEEAYEARERLAAMQADGLESPFVVTNLRGRKQAVVALSKAPAADDDLYAPYFEFSFDVVSTDSFRYGEEVWSTTELPYAGSGLAWPLGGGAADGLLPTGSYEPVADDPTVYSTAGLTPVEGVGYLPREGSAPGWLDWGSIGSLGQAHVRNDGTADTYPVLEIAGGLELGFLLTWVPTGAQIRFDRHVPPGSVITLNPRTGRALIDGQSDVTGFLTVSDWWPVERHSQGSIQFAALGGTTGTPTLTARTAPAYL